MGEVIASAYRVQTTLGTQQHGNEGRREGDGDEETKDEDEKDEGDKRLGETLDRGGLRLK